MLEFSKGLCAHVHTRYLCIEVDIKNLLSLLREIVLLYVCFTFLAFLIFCFPTKIVQPTPDEVISTSFYCFVRK